jgi:hypothetical protein
MVVHELAHGFYADIAIFLIITLIAGLVAFFRNIRRCLDKQSSRSLRLSKAMELLAREIDKQTNRHHEDALSTLKQDIEDQLTDEKGNL